MKTRTGLKINVNKKTDLTLTLKGCVHVAWEVGIPLRPSLLNPLVKSQSHRIFWSYFILHINQKHTNKNTLSLFLTHTRAFRQNGQWILKFHSLHERPSENLQQPSHTHTHTHTRSVSHHPSVSLPAQTHLFHLLSPLPLLHLPFLSSSPLSRLPRYFPLSHFLSFCSIFLSLSLSIFPKPNFSLHLPSHLSLLNLFCIPKPETHLCMCVCMCGVSTGPRSLLA